MGKADKYWHIQMYKPEGKGGIEIDSMKMLQEPYPVRALKKSLHGLC